jgi:hypothetical protein
MKSLHLVSSADRAVSRLDGITVLLPRWSEGTRPGNALFVPPPVVELNARLDQFERFFHETLTTPSSYQSGLSPRSVWTVMVASAVYL